MRKRKRGRGTMRPPLLSFLALAVAIRWGTSRPVSIVHQEQEPPPPLRKSQTDRSAFAREAASAARVAAKSAATSAAAPAEHDNNPNADDSSRRAKHPALASNYADVDASLGVILPGESGHWDAQAVVLPGERTSMIVAGTVDGQVHALDPATGDLKWSFSTGEPLVKSYQQLPGPLDDKKWWIPMLDGSMLVHTSQGLRRPGLNARVLVEQTPFLSGRTFYTGSKVSRIFGVDAHTGELRQVLSGDTADGLESNRRLLARSGSDDDVIWIGRDDYTARAFDVSTGQEEWNLTIGQFVSLDGLYLEAAPGAAAADSSSSSSSGNGGARKAAAAAAAAQLEQTNSLIATPDGSLRLKALAGVKTDKVNSVNNRNNRAPPQSSDFDSDDHWNVPLPAHVASVFQVALEEGSAHSYIPMRQMPLSQSAGVGESMVSSGTGGAAVVGVLDNGQVYAVALGEHDNDGEDSGDGGGGGSNRSAGGGVSAAGGHGSRGKKSRAGEGKVTHGGRATATQPLLPHGDWQRDGGGDGIDHGGGSDGGGHGLSNALVQSLSKGSSQTATSGPPKWCQPGNSDFPNCLSGMHTVRQSRLSPVDWNAGSGLEGGAGAGQVGGVRASTHYRSRLPSPSNGDQALPGGGSGGGGASLAEMIGKQGVGAGPRNYLTQTTSPQGPMHSLLSWLYHGWSLVSLGILAVVVMVIIDSRRAAKLLKQVGLGTYPLNAARGSGAGEYDPTSDGGFSGVSDSPASTAGGGGAVEATAAAAATAVVVTGGVKGELRVGCLTVSDAVLGYGSHGTVVYRGLLEGRPVAVKRMLTDFHARADREISLLIESDGHPNVVRYFVREEAGEFVYLALQLCQLSLHNAMAQIHGAMAWGRRKIDLEKGENSGALRVGLGRALTTEDVSAPTELRAALLQVSQGVEHLHSLRIVHRDLKPHNILLAAKDRKGPGLGRKLGSTVPNGVGRGEGEEEGGLEVPRKLSSMRDVSNFVLKISDMGLGKQLLNGQSSFGMSSYGRTPGRRDQGQGGDALARARASNAQASSSAGGHIGSIGWQAPEVIADRVSLEGGQGPSPVAGAEGSLSSSGSSSSWAMAGGSSSSSSRRTQAVDIFSLGCIFHHCIVPGSHPFGQWYEREANIIQDKASHLEELAHVPDAYDLVSLMTAREPDLRPSAGEVCKHPFFWNEEKRLSFLLEFSDRLEQDSVQSPLLVMVESGADQVVGRSWDVRLDPELTEDAGRYRKYDFSSVRDLLRVVRNKRHHFHELPERVQGLMSPLPSGFLRYVEDRFPQLLMHCTKVTGALLSEERLFKEYLVPFRRRPPTPSASAAPAMQPVAPVTTTPGASAAVKAPEMDGLSGERSTPHSPMPSVGSKSAVAPDPTTPPPPQALLSPTPRAANTPGSSLGNGVWAEESAGAGSVGAAGTLSPAVTTNGSAGSRGSARGREAFSCDGQGSSISPVKRSAGTTPRSGRKTYEGGDGGADGALGNAAARAGSGVPVRVTRQNGPCGENALQDVLVWNESGMAKSMGCRGWWRHQDHWNRRLDVTKQRPRGAHLNKALQDPKYRTRLCSHWENSKGMLCPMRRRGAGKCDFAHGGLELRVRANKRDRWGRHVGSDGGGVSLDASGGEDTLGAARSIGRIRIENGEKDGAGCAAIAGGRGGGGAGTGGGGGGGGPRQGKRSKGGGAAAQGGDGAGGGGNGGNQGRARGVNGSAGESKGSATSGGVAREGGAAGEGRPQRERGAPPDSGESNGDVARKLRPATATVAVVPASNDVGRPIENGTMAESRVGLETRGRSVHAGGGNGQASSEGAAASDSP